ncbi:hypothetical protein AMS68_000780 [Peltaster fructicola]|uniref:Uncharacterized protein n=1 Tax=Peltaster fructicola TaxID=286661 RepID=A0A6H0XKL4_9PEZI|nr:hypothetical protein AMS68_000780 [Peltaster fructicola]
MAAIDIADLLELHNPDKGGITCVGTAPSRGRRCRNAIAAGNILKGKDLIREIPDLVTKPKELRSTLLQIATCLLCKQLHQSQAREISRGWRYTLLYVVDAPKRESKEVHTPGSKNELREHEYPEDAWASAMLAHAKQDTRPSTLKHEDSGYGSDHSGLFGDDDDLSSLHQSSPKRQQAKLVDPQATTMHAQIPPVNDQPNDVEVLSSQMCDASTQTTEEVAINFTPQMKIAPSRLVTQRQDGKAWLSRVESQGRQIVFWACMLVVTDMLMRVR